jgi:PEP-CTERM motif-containing protein
MASGVRATLISSGDFGATLVTYQVTFNANYGPSGVGSFVANEDTKQVTSFIWNFEGMEGGMRDDAPVMANGVIYEMFTGLDGGTTLDCTGLSHCRIPIASYLYGWPVSAGGYIQEFAAGFSTSYGRRIISWDGASPVAFSGGLIEVTSVPEPTTLGLFAAGLLGMFLRRRREVLA